jgi:adenylate cyclase
MQYTVVGDSVNLAARLCETSQAGQVWFSQEVLQERDIRQRIEAVKEGALTLKGKTRETLCYRLDKLQSPFDQLLQRQMQHLLAQLEGNA